MHNLLRWKLFKISFSNGYNPSFTKTSLESKMFPAIFCSFHIHISQGVRLFSETFSRRKTFHSLWYVTFTVLSSSVSFSSAESLPFFFHSLNNTFNTFVWFLPVDFTDGQLFPVPFKVLDLKHTFTHSLPLHAYDTVTAQVMWYINTGRIKCDFV